MKALSIVDIRSWAQDLIMMDDPEIIAAIQNQVLPRRGFSATKDEIMVTVGAQHALYLLADLLVRPGNKVGMEEPGYPDARNIFPAEPVTWCRYRSTKRALMSRALLLIWT